MSSKTLLIFLFVYFLMCSSHEQRSNSFFRSDYSYLEAVSSFYKIHLIPRTWTEAKQVCALEGATLWHPDNENEANIVLSFWNATQPDIRSVYVGLTDRLIEGLFETIDGKSASKVYNEWFANQPDDYGGKEDCVHLNKGLARIGVLSDTLCDAENYFICKKSLQSLEWNVPCNISNKDYTFNEDTNKCYKVHTTPLNWREAYAVCRLEQSSLAMINSRLEAEHLANLTEYTQKPRLKDFYQRGMYHVGFHNIFNEGWQSVKGTPMQVDADAWWDNYQPDERDQCASMFYTGRLINIDCSMKSLFICEHEPEANCNEQQVDNKILPSMS